LRQRASDLGVEVTVHAIDLEVDQQIESFARAYLDEESTAHILVHSAGIFLDETLRGGVEGLDAQLRTNLRAPYVLTKALLPALRASQGDIIFINSSAGLSAKGGAAQYSATKHGLKAFADGLREEVNDAGVRVLSIYPGRTASAMQEAIHAMERRSYRPESLMQPDDVATVVLCALQLSRSAELTDVRMRPLRKPASS
jgi:short-subunit dehydrogenase